MVRRSARSRGKGQPDRFLPGATCALVLHPVAAGFTFLALLVSLGTHFVVGVLASLLAAWAFLVTLIAFIVSFTGASRSTATNKFI